MAKKNKQKIAKHQAAWRRIGRYLGKRNIGMYQQNDSEKHGKRRGGSSRERRKKASKNNGMKMKNGSGIERNRKQHGISGDSSVMAASAAGAGEKSCNSVAISKAASNQQRQASMAQASDNVSSSISKHQQIAASACGKHRALLASKQNIWHKIISNGSSAVACAHRAAMAQHQANAPSTQHQPANRHIIKQRASENNGKHQRKKSCGQARGRQGEGEGGRIVMAS